MRMLFKMNGYHCVTSDPSPCGRAPIVVGGVNKGIAARGPRHHKIHLAALFSYCKSFVYGRIHVGVSDEILMVG